MKLPDAFSACLRGIMPANVITCSKDGTPNATTVSQVFPAGPGEIAISNQFLSKSHRNLLENPYAEILVGAPEGGNSFVAQVRHLRTDTEGELFDIMEMELEAVASMTGMSGVFKLQAVDVFEVLDVRLEFADLKPA